MDYPVLKKNFENHRFHTSYFETKEEAAAYLAEQIKGETVGFGGCMTAKEMDLFEILKKNNEVIWHWEQGPDARIRAKKESTVYILSANAAAETGQIINIDGSGNRLSESLFGPKRVYYVIRSRRICPPQWIAREISPVQRTRRVLTRRLHASCPMTKSAMTATVRSGSVTRS